MSKKKWLLVALAMLMIVALAAGCGPEEVGPANGENGEEPDGDEKPAAEWPSTLSLGTASVGGVYFIYGGWGNLVAEIVGIPVNLEQTGGPADNMMLVQDRAVDLGMITMGIGYEAWNGLPDTAFAGQKHTDVRAIFPMYSTYSQWWAHKNSGITTLHDLEGKKVGVGPTGGTPGTYHPLILEVLGVNATPVWGALGDLVESHADLQIDANSFSSGVPVAGLLQYEATVGSDNVVMLPIDGEDRDKVIEAYPYWVADVIKQEIYPFMDGDLETINVFNWAICHKDLPEDLIYEIVDAVLSNNDRMVEIHASAWETLPENAGTNTFLPMHPGAYDWFMDNGYDVPDGAKPID